MSIEINRHIILNNEDYFAIADEFSMLQDLFKQNTLFEKISFLVDMILYPLINICSVLFFKEDLGALTIISIHKTVLKWEQYLHYLKLKSDTDTWKQLVKNIGGPFISTNDEKYHMYVYADAMQRSKNSFFKH